MKGNPTGERGIEPLLSPNETQPTTDRSWLVPSVAVTILSGLFALLLIPSYSGIVPALMMVPYWMLAAAIIASLFGFVSLVRARVQSPIARIHTFIVEDWRALALWAACIFLAGVNMTTFMWTKPLLNYLVPFWADPVLATIDNALFFGQDPWALLSGLNSTPAAIFYHRGWFALMILTLVIVLSAPPSPERSALMLTYFLLWSVVGPLIHTLLPAGGPIFYAQMGYGDRFGGLENVSETKEVADFLWTVYAGTGFAPGGGISAMPSLHIATTAWMVMAVYICARWLIIPITAAGLLIFLLSIALGWHYAVDGLVGGGAALICYRLLRLYFSRSPLPRRQAVAV